MATTPRPQGVKPAAPATTEAKPATAPALAPADGSAVKVDRPQVGTPLTTTGLEGAGTEAQPGDPDVALTVPVAPAGDYVNAKPFDIRVSAPSGLDENGQVTFDSVIVAPGGELPAEVTAEELDRLVVLGYVGPNLQK